MNINCKSEIVTFLYFVEKTYYDESTRVPFDFLLLVVNIS